MNETHLYQLQHAGPQVVDQWREVKKDKVEKRKQRNEKESRKNGEVAQIVEQRVVPGTQVEHRWKR